MEYRNLGRSGLKVSKICLGAMMFGDQTDEPTAREIVASARDAGVNFIDTADAYARGVSEEMVGRAVAQDRDRWVIATKVGYMSGVPAAAGPDLSRKYITLAAERSLKRLGTDYIDIYYLHRDDFDTHLEETVGALGDLIRAGKIRHIGISNFRAWRTAEFVRVCDAMGVGRPVASQPQYNAANRQPESELLPACQFYGIGVVPYSPLARGILTAKYAGLDALPEGSRAARRDVRMVQVELRAESIEMAKAIQAHAAARGTNATHFALNWVLNNRIVTSVIAGPRTMEQWQDYLAALQAPPLDAEDEALVNRLVPAGFPSTHGFVDPNYPVMGRIAR